MEYLLNKSSNRDQSHQIFQRGLSLMPGGVSSPGRAFSEVENGPLVIQAGQGKYIQDADGNRYVDFICGLGPVILGHGQSEVLEAVAKQFEQGSVYGTPSKIEYELAEAIIRTSRFLDSIRFTCSGTEATMTALRIARAHTGKQAVLKFQGGYHGHSDTLLAGGTKRHMLPEDGKISVRNGIAQSAESNTYLADFNDIESVDEAFFDSRNEIGAIIVEPVPSNMGVITPNKKFLEHLRTTADRAGAVLIFDEVVSGFRHRFGPIADFFDVQPDIITFGKIIGGGLPVGAFGGKAELMALLVARGSVFQGGTFAGSPLTMAAGLAQLNILDRDDVLSTVNRVGKSLAENLKTEFGVRNLPFSAQNFGSLVTPILIPNCDRLLNYRDVIRQDKALFSHIHTDLLTAGFAIPPTIEEPIFISACHTEADVAALACTYANSAALHCKLMPT